MVNPYFNEQAQNQYWEDKTQEAVNSYSTSQSAPKNNKMTTQDYINSVGSGMSIGAANATNPDDFIIDPNAGFTASNQGLAQGNWITAITAGVTAQMGQQQDLKNSLNNLNTSVQGANYDAYGRPTYQGGNILNAQKTVDQLNQGEKAMTEGLFEGGEGIDPATLVFNEVYGNTRRLRKKRRELQAGIDASNKAYNEAEVGYRNRQNQMEDFRQRNNNNARLYHLYRSQY